ncbi:hypothetical protein SteCoe_3894 [Stentor coeruleus]|uniref:Phosphatidate cytidylyltransferase n=1 Tax=Stentor coeruleus TaxID=5963 RepID=A0A1R2CW09_9CILI|nr:hypothetical protein SteCoe_3894 [Stentor coeruleus]
MVLTVFITFFAATQEYFAITQAVYMKNFKSDIINDFKGISLPIFLLPFGFLIGSFTSHTEVFICLSLVLIPVVIVVYRLYQYSNYCSRKNPDDPINKFSFIVLSVIFGDIFFCVFLGFPFCYSLLLNGLPGGQKYSFLWLYTTFQTDNGALLFGKLFGTYKPFPYISPQKTVQGLIGAYVFCFISLLALIPFGETWITVKMTIGDALVITIASSTLGIVGDLTESFLKRTAGVKDSGNIFPGHGGILDRLDSLVWVTPFIYYYLVYFMI